MLDQDLFELRRAGRSVPIEPQAIRVLMHLVTHRGRLVRKDELLDAVWGNRFVTESALSSQIKAIRRATGDTGQAQRVVRTVHGQGYRFVAPVREEAGEGHAPEHAGGQGARASPADQDRPLVAVLPFADLSPTARHAHVARGFTHEMIVGLSKHRWLRVLTWAATAGVAGHPDAVAHLREQLGGSVTWWRGRSGWTGSISGSLPASRTPPPGSACGATASTGPSAICSMSWMS